MRQILMDTIQLPAKVLKKIKYFPTNHRVIGFGSMCWPAQSQFDPTGIYLVTREMSRTVFGTLTGF